MADCARRALTDNLVDTDVYTLTIDNNTDQTAPASPHTDMVCDVLGFTPKVIELLKTKLPDNVEVII